MTLSAQVIRATVVLRLWMAAVVPAAAQDWAGAYVSGHIGFSRIPEGSNNMIVFDRDLDGDFDDTITTAAGANAFSPGFCGGAAAGAQPTGGCAVDDDGFDAGGRAGYDWQMGRLLFGIAGELAFVDHVDSVSAFSTTPAFYTFTRELEWLGGVRARAGFGSERVLAYGTGGLAWGGPSLAAASSSGSADGGPRAANTCGPRWPTRIATPCARRGRRPRPTPLSLATRAARTFAGPMRSVSAPFVS